jgi:hypothetical protein
MQNKSIEHEKTWQCSLHHGCHSLSFSGWRKRGRQQKRARQQKLGEQQKLGGKQGRDG